MNRPFILSSLVAFSLLASGCAHYEYDLVNPPDLARHIGTAADAVVQVDPLEYRLRTYENRLVMSIFNPTPDPITLAGDRSYVVDPAGQSHPLRIQTIAPGTFIRLVLPPMRPGYYQSSPSIGIGFGVAYSHYYHGHHYGYGAFGYDPFFYDQPTYYTYYDESDNTYWNWEGQTPVRLHLVYFRAAAAAGSNNREPFTHDFTFARKKM
jgi:hypothetical protein